MSSQKTFSAFDMFAGIGGFRLGVEGAGWDTTFAIDNDKHCKETYDHNFLKNGSIGLSLEDARGIETDDIPDFDFLLGGFPCQPFSVANGKAKHLDDPRGNLFLEIVRVLKERRPTGFILENVDGLARNSDAISLILNSIYKAGYKYAILSYNTSQFGIPQNRKRIFIFGLRDGIDANPSIYAPPAKDIPPIMSFLDDPDDIPSNFRVENKPLGKQLPLNEIESGFAYQWRRTYLRKNKQGVVPCLTQNMGAGGSNVPLVRDEIGVRQLTPNECLRLQGFPEWYKFPESVSNSQRYRQAGNSVCPKIVEYVANNISNSLK